MNRKGFTLLEILISLTLLAVVLAIIYEAFFQNIKTMEASRGVEERYQIGRTALDIIAREIEGAYFVEKGSLYISFLGIDDQSVEGEPRDTLHFVGKVCGAARDEERVKPGPAEEWPEGIKGKVSLT